MSASLIAQLVEKRLNVWEQTKQHLDTVEKEGRDFSGEAEESYKRLVAEIDSLDERISELHAIEKRNADFEEVRAQYAPAAAKATKQTEAEQLRAFCRGELGKSYEVELRDVTTTAGAGLIQQGFHNELWQYAVEESGIMSAGVDVWNTSSGEQIKVPRVTAYSTTADISEGVAITESDPTFSSVNSDVSKRGYLIEVPTEFIQDSAFNISTYLAQWAGRELGNDVGSNAVSVALAAASAGATTAAGTAGGLGAQNTADRGFDYLITLFHSVLAPYRRRNSCGWLMSDPTAAMVRRVKSADGVYAWEPSTTAGQPDLILGKPVQVDTYVPDAAVSVESILFGDFSSVKVRIAGGIRFERSDDVGFNKDVATFRAIVRRGAVSVDANALKTLTHAGT